MARATLRGRVGAHTTPRSPGDGWGPSGIAPTTVEAAPAVIHYGDLAIDRERYLVTFAGDPVSLTHLEFVILLRIAEADGRVVPYEELARSCWSEPLPNARRRLAVLTSRIRGKLGPGQRYLKTVQRVGYQLAPLH